MLKIRKNNGPVIVCVLTLAMAIASCSSSTPTANLFAETASFDIAAGPVDRLMVGVSDKDGNSLTGGTVTFRLRPLDGTWSSPVPARSVAVPGRPAPTGDTPRLTAPSVAVGVYATETVTIPAAGFWELEIDAGELGTAITAFEAHDSPTAAAVGSSAPQTDNPTIDSPSITPSQLDSLALDATDMSALTDSDLHRVQISEALRARRPLAVVVATPAYCTSQFCGPLVSEFAKLRSAYSNVDFVHLEVFPDGFDKPVSTFAAQWILQTGAGTSEGNEPWVFVVDGSGTITQRWDNVVEFDKLRTELARLNN
jgi:hypothetical protein